MGATSIHVQAVKPGSEIHNFREKELDYVRPELSHLNESWVGDSISHRLESAKQRYLDTVGQKMQAKAAPIREGVIVIKQETTMQELQQFATVCKERFGIEAFQIHIHKDEGYMNAKQWTPNLHAHVVFDWTQPNGKSVRLSRDDMAELQTIASETLGMERGVSSDRKHLSAMQYKTECAKEQLQELSNDISSALDKPRMNQLPGESYTLCDYKYFLKVPDNYHLEYDAHYYSVLYTYKGKPAILKATMTEIRICDEYNRLICRHPRSYRDFPLYITDDNHMPPEHLYYKEVNAHDGAYYRRWASVYGESMVTLIDRILRSSKHEEQAYNSCAGVLHSCKDVPHRLVQEAAEKCVEANACKYSYFKKVLSMVQNNHSSSAINGTGKLPSHTNIRGKEAYK